MTTAIKGSNLSSCQGVFIQSKLVTGTTNEERIKTSYSSYSKSKQSPTLQSIDRHHRNTSHILSSGSGPSSSSAKTTKKNKLKNNLWDKIQEEFLPELLEEYTSHDHDDNTNEINCHEIMNHDNINDSGSEHKIQIPEDVTNTSPKREKQHCEKQMKMSTLFIKPETNVECLYRRSSIREACDVCSSDVVLTDDGFLTCKNPSCSIIYTDESLDQTAEWRYYGADDNQVNDPTRCGMPVNPLLVESSYGCKVMCEGGSYSQDMMKIRRYTEWQSMPYKEKAQYDMFQKITTIAQNNGISKMIIDEALRVHKRISEHKTFRSLNRDGVVGASIYISCKMHNCPRTAKEIATIFNLDNTSATKGCKNAVSIINELESNLENSEKTTFCKTKPEAFIERYCSRLNINDELTKVCQFIAVLIEKNNLIPENTPHSIASGIIYFVAHMCKLPISKKDVNRISDMSEVTINKCFKKLYDMRERLIPGVILKKYSAI
jgi:transcription initiation factor TFIIB